MNLIVNSVQLAGQGGEMEQRNGGGGKGVIGGDEDEMERRGEKAMREKQKIKEMRWEETKEKEQNEN